MGPAKSGKEKFCKVVTDLPMMRSKDNMASFVAEIQAPFQCQVRLHKQILNSFATKDFMRADAGILLIDL